MSVKNSMQIQLGESTHPLSRDVHNNTCYRFCEDMRLRTKKTTSLDEDDINNIIFPSFLFPEKLEFSEHQPYHGLMKSPFLLQASDFSFNIASAFNAARRLRYIEPGYVDPQPQLERPAPKPLAVALSLVATKLAR